MLDKLDFELAGKTLVIVSSCLVIFHVANLLGYVPHNITWLGQIDSNRIMLIMGFVSIALNLLVILCALTKCKFWSSASFNSIVEKILPFVFWWLVGNTIANLFAKSKFEVVVFTPILIVLTVCMYRLKTHSEVSATHD